MALTRKMLKAMGIEEEKIDQIIDAHTEAVDALKAQRDQYEADAKKLSGVQKELDDLKAAGDGGYKEKYEIEHQAFEKFKADTASEKENSKKESLYRALLKSCNVDPKRIDAIIKVTNMKGLKMDGEGLADEDKLKEGIKSEWSGFIMETRTDGAEVETPPPGDGGSEEDLGSMSMKDYIAARRKM